MLSLANKDGKTVWIFLKVFPFLFSNKIPIKVLNDLLKTMKEGCLCALCGAIPVPISNILKYFGDEMKNDIVKEN